MKLPPPKPEETTLANRWWSGFFDSPWLDVQRRVKSAAQTAAEVRFMTRALSLDRPSTILDAPCGVGRVSIELAALGHRVTGIDITEAFIDDARRAAADRGVDAEFVLGDMRDLPRAPEFDAVICWWGSFGYFDETGNFEFLQAAQRALKPGGRLLIDTHVMETLLPNMTERSWRRVENMLVLEQRRYDFESSRTLTEWTFIRDGRAFSKDTSIRLYSYGELARLLASAGFGRLEPYGSLDAEPFALGSDRLYLVAHKG